MSEPTYYRSQSDDTSSAGAYRIRPLLVALAFFVFANFCITEWLALTLHEQDALSRPLFHLLRVPIYPPYMWAYWEIHLWISSPAARTTFLYAFGAGLMAYLFSFAVFRLEAARITRLKDNRHEDLHGSARWATDKEILQTGKVGLTGGPFIGAYESAPGQLTYLRDDSDGMILATAPTGSGKTAGLIVPTMLSNEEYSIIALDPKGQLLQLTSGYRKQTGSHIFNFAPASRDSSKFNIFREIRRFTDHDFADASNIMHLIYEVPGETSGDPHWRTIARTLATGVLLHEAYKAANEGRDVTGADIAEAFTPTQTSFKIKLKEMVTYAHDPTGSAGWTFADGSATRNHPAVRRAANEMWFHRLDADGEPNKEFSACLSEASKRFEIYQDPLIRRATSGSDFAIDDLVNHDKPVTLYIQVPISDEERLRPLIRTTLSMFFYRLTEQRRITTRNKHPLLWELEEFPTLREMDFVQTAMPLARDFGMKFHLVAQGTGQIDKEYKDQETIINNCDIWSAYAPNDDQTVDKLSKRTGKRTVAVRTQSFAGKRYAAGKDSVTESIQYVERELMTPDEVRRLRAPRKQGDRIVEPGDMLVFIKGHRPILGRQMLYFFDPIFRARAEIPPATAWQSIR